MRSSCLRILCAVFGLVSLATVNQTAQSPAFGANESILWSFTYGGAIEDGLNPDSGVIMDAGGNIYGTTLYGGTNNQGAVFKLPAQGNESVLWSFGNGNDGSLPAAGLTMDASGNLYGATL
jgi:uncharacterized repeat protein (TIGR03803 family)